MYYLDTCICVDFLRGRLSGFKEAVSKTSPRLYGIPAIVEAELLFGAERSKMPKQERLKVESFLLPLASIPFDARCAIEYARIRAHLSAEGELIGPNDMLIAATALANGAQLVTHNVKEFARVPGLQVIDWSEMAILGFAAQIEEHRTGRAGTAKRQG